MFTLSNCDPTNLNTPTMAANFNGTWKNQNKSTLELKEAGGIISGRFESGVGDDGQVVWIDVSGRVLDDVITFNALYQKFGTVVSWVGQMTKESGTDVIKTHWLHATNIPDDQEQARMWSSNRIGSDIFTRTQKV